MRSNSGCPEIAGALMSNLPLIEPTCMENRMNWANASIVTIAVATMFLLPGKTFDDFSVTISALLFL
jgi:hypothetical protein